MTTIWIMALEPIESRYTIEWFEHIPNQLKLEAQKRNQDVRIVNISGNPVPSQPSPGAFLDFAATNIWKSSQVEKFMHHVQAGTVKPGDHVLFTDAWHPGLLQIRYTSDLQKLDLKISSLWHAGAYDKNDFLGRAKANLSQMEQEWYAHIERALYHASTYNYFATHDHIKLFNSVYGSGPKTFRTGWPMEYLPGLFEQKSKEKIVVFPHRIAPEKQLEIFNDLAKTLPQYKWVVCQEKNLTKKEYRELMSRATLSFSANLQETLGISQMEAIFANTFALSPDRLSYSEMYNSTFLYPSEWTESFENYLQYKDKLVMTINLIMNSNRDYRNELTEQKEKLQDYISATLLYQNLLGD